MNTALPLSAHRVRHTLLAVALLAASAAFAQLPDGITKGVTVEGITEYDLANGMRVLLLPDKSSQKFVVNITYLVGSRHEGYGEKGMSHLLEHMLFRSTSNNSAPKKDLTNHGAEFNGSTWYDRTNYYEILPAADTTLKWAIGYEADRMVNCLIAQEELDKEMTVVRNEFEEDENSPGRILSERVLSTAYLWHNYGFSSIGPKSDIEKVPATRLKVYYQKYYQPDDAVLVIGGNFDVDNALKYIDATFGKIPKPARSLDLPYTTEPTQDGERSVTLRRTGDVYDVCAAYHIPAGSDPDAPAIDLLMQIISDRTWGRLYHALVEPKIASTAYAYTYSLHDPGVALAFAETHHADSLELMRDILVKTMESMSTSDITADELKKAQSSLEKEFENTVNSSSDLAISLSESAAMGDWRLFFVQRDRTKSVTVDDLKRVAAAYFKPSNRTLGMFIPTKNPDRAVVPDPPNVAEIVGKYKNTHTVEAGEEFDATPEVIDARTITKTLPIGMKLALLSKKTRANKVHGMMQLHFGSEATLTGLRAPAGVAGGMLMRGTKHHTREQIQTLLDSMKTELSVSGSLQGANVYFETTREHLSDVLDLAAEILREPAYDEKEFGLFTEARVTGLESSRSQPFQLGFTEFGRRMSPYPKDNIRYQPSVDENIADAKSAKLDDAKAFYKKFYGANNSECAIVGDFDVDQVTAKLSSLFDGWKSSVPYERVRTDYKEADTSSEDISAPDKAGAVVIGGEAVHMRDDDPDYPAVVIGNYLLGGGELSSRLSLRIRDKEGLSYGVGSFLQADIDDSTTVFGAYGICAPQNVTKFETSLRDEITKTIHDGFGADEVEKGRQGWLQLQKVGRAEDRNIAGALESNLHHNRTYAWKAALEQKITALTPEQISAAMRKHLDPAKIFVIRVADASKRDEEKK